MPFTPIEEETYGTFTPIAPTLREKAREIVFKEPREAESMGEWITKTVPESALRMAYGIPAFFYETGKEAIKPIKERITGEYPFYEAPGEMAKNITDRKSTRLNSSHS